MDKGVEAGQKAKYYENKAEAIENNHAISSDDPEALTKLTTKLNKLQAWQETMKACNKVIKNSKQNDEWKIEILVKMEVPEQAARKLLEKDFAGRIGFASYLLTNNNANIKRIQQQIQQLQKTESMESKEEDINGIRIVSNVEGNRLEIPLPLTTFFRELVITSFRARLITGFRY